MIYVLVTILFLIRRIGSRKNGLRYSVWRCCLETAEITTQSTSTKCSRMRVLEKQNTKSRILTLDTEGKAAKSWDGGQISTFDKCAVLGAWLFSQLACKVTESLLK